MQRRLPPFISNPIPATFLRGGTSKGIFIKRSDLPDDRTHWDRIFLGIMGSPDPIHKRQLNGMGGGVSSLSKICVVAPSTEQDNAKGIDVEYTFVQVGIADDGVDYSGNCGNLSSMIGVFALDEGLCKPSPSRLTDSHATVRAFNTNTSKIVDTTFPIRRSANGSEHLEAVMDLHEAKTAGVPGLASKIVMEFISPSGARTGKLLPTGNPVDNITINTSPTTTIVRASLVDATNPTVFIHSSSSNILPPTPLSSSLTEPGILSVLETVRQEAARLMQLDPSFPAQPKIAILSPPTPVDENLGINIRVHALSMGVLHRAVPMTVGLCLGIASGIKGTLAWDIVQRSTVSRQKAGGLVRIGHPSGEVDVGAEISDEGEVASAKVVRTGRRLMKGRVWW